MTVTELVKHFPDKIVDLPYPKAYPGEGLNPLAIKGIVLGCDPSNFSNKDGSTRELETVFGIEGKGKDKRYFTGILKNLSQVGLTLENIYVQNLCRNYFTQVTSKNKQWNQAAQLWAATLKKELEDLKIPKSVPVFLTSMELYRALLNSGVMDDKAEVLYKEAQLLQPIASKDNLLGRPLFMLFRGGNGKYSLEKWPAYKAQIHDLLMNV
ncbi:hypothetical protein N9H15_02380 [bacterium]|nr:hypothetical protein [bacterium]